MCSPEDKACVEVHKSPNLPIWVSMLHHWAQRVTVQPKLSAYDFALYFASCWINLSAFGTNSSATQSQFVLCYLQYNVSIGNFIMHRIWFLIGLETEKSSAKALAFFYRDFLLRHCMVESESERIRWGKCESNNCIPDPNTKVFLY